MGFKFTTLELASLRGEEVFDKCVGVKCEVKRFTIEKSMSRYVLLYPDGIKLPILWDEHAQGKTSRARALQGNR